VVLNRSRDTQGLGFTEVLQRLLSAGRWRVLDIDIAMVADHAGTEIAAGSALFDAVAEQLFRRLVYHLPRHVDEKAARYFSRVEPAPAVAAAPEEKPLARAPVRPAAQPQIKSRRPLSVAAEKWLELRAPRPQSCIEAKRAVSRFIDIHGDLPASARRRRPSPSHVWFRPAAERPLTGKRSQKADRLRDRRRTSAFDPERTPRMWRSPA
jgi:hypothetical protein